MRGLYFLAIFLFLFLFIAYLSCHNWVRDMSEYIWALNADFSFSYGIDHYLDVNWFSPFFAFGSLR